MLIELPKWTINLPWQAIREAAEQFNLEPYLIAAIIMTESGGNPCAMRFEPSWRWFLPSNDSKAYAEKIGSTVATELSGQATSWGLMQVMGTVARELGHDGWFAELCNPVVGIKYGCKHLRAKWDIYGSKNDAIAAYNAGSVVTTPGGNYMNEVYVDKVLSYYRQLNRLDDDKE